MRPSHVIVVLCALCSVASADPLSELSGRVLDSQLGTPVESATVLVAGQTGVEHTLTTDSAGRYQTAVAPGSYILVFVYGSARSSGRITVAGGMPARVPTNLSSHHALGHSIPHTMNARIGRPDESRAGSNLDFLTSEIAMSSRS